MSAQSIQNENKIDLINIEHEKYNAENDVAALHTAKSNLISTLCNTKFKTTKPSETTAKTIQCTAATYIVNKVCCAKKKTLRNSTINSF